jgi:hypothetical protein
MVIFGDWFVIGDWGYGHVVDWLPTYRETYRWLVDEK